MGNIIRILGREVKGYAKEGNVCETSPEKGRGIIERESNKFSEK